jgi:MoaA/NifB/PqqE/SkfB family radical SAM enzyme
MEGDLKTVRLRADAFIRQIHDIGFIYDMSNRRQEVFDSNGAAFLRQIGRTFRTTDDIVDLLQRTYSNTPREVLRRDFLEFSEYLLAAGFIETEDKSSQPMVTQWSGADGISKDRGMAETSDFLKSYFALHPTVFSFQLYTTDDCNESCVHCYVERGAKERQLPLERKLDIIDQLGTLGTLDITFTGGEALLSADLPHLIRRARERDLVVALLSNLTLLTDEMRDLLVDANVELVQTSLYSMNPDTHDRITRRSGSHRKTLLAIEKLKSAGVRVSVSCPIMTENLHCFHEVLRFGAENGIPVSCDPTIMAKENGDVSNLVHRIATRDLDQVLTTIIDNSPKYREILEQSPATSDADTAETCGIGQYMLCLKSTGEYVPCPGFGLVVGDAWKSDIAEVWQQSPQLIELRNFNRKASFPQCTGCDASGHCNFCLAKFHNEQEWNSSLVPTGYCEIARSTKRVVRERLLAGFPTSVS